MRRSLGRSKLAQIPAQKGGGDNDMYLRIITIISIVYWIYDTSDELIPITVVALPIRTFILSLASEASAIILEHVENGVHPN